MSLEAYFQQPRERQNALRGSAVRVDLSCSRELDETPQPSQTKDHEIFIDGEILIDGGIDLSASLERESYATILRVPVSGPGNENRSDHILSELANNTTAQTPYGNEEK